MCVCSDTQNSVVEILQCEYLHTGYSAVISRTTSTVKGVSPISEEQCFGKASKPLMRLILAKGNGYVTRELALILQTSRDLHPMNLGRMKVLAPP